MATADLRPPAAAGSGRHDEGGAAGGAQPIFDGPCPLDVRDGDRLVATQDVRVRTDDDVELRRCAPPARQPASASSRRRSRSPAATGRAEMAALPADVLDLGPIGLEAYDTIVGTGADLVDLEDSQRRALLLWVDTRRPAAGRRRDRGRRPPGTVAPRPGRLLVGRPGEVRLVDGAASRRGAGPRSSSRPGARRPSTWRSGPRCSADPRQDLADTGRRPAPEPGPVDHHARRLRARHRIPWSTCPAPGPPPDARLGRRPARRRADGNGHRRRRRVASDRPGATPPWPRSSRPRRPARLAVSNTLLLQAARAATCRSPTPAGWQVDEPMPMFGSDERRSPRVLRRTAAAPACSTSAGGRAGRRPTLRRSRWTSRGLDVTAAMTADGAITGNVINGTDATMHDVAVFVGDRRRRCRRSGAGRVVPPGPPMPPLRSPASPLVPTGCGRHRSATASTGRPTGRVRHLGDWRRPGWELFPTGLARVVGWTDGLPATCRAGRGTSNRTAVSATTSRSTRPASRSKRRPCGRRSSAARSARSVAVAVAGTAQVYATSCRRVQRPTGWSSSSRASGATGRRRVVLGRRPRGTEADSPTTTRVAVPPAASAAAPS